MEMMMLHCHESHDAELMMAIMMFTMMNISRGSMKIENLNSVKICPSDNREQTILQIITIIRISI